MPAKIQIVGYRQRVNTTGATVVNTCSNAATGWERDLSPFILGPCDLYAPYTARNMENAWQYAKVYEDNAIAGNPTKRYWTWARLGWANPRAVRYPMGKGARPLYSYWDGQKLGYIDARKQIYGPLYGEAVQQTAGWKTLQNLYQTTSHLILRDYDGHDHDALGLTLTQVLNNPRRKMGHAFVLKMLLTNDPALQQMNMR